MRCLVTAGKHIKNIRLIARQPPIITIDVPLEAAFVLGPPRGHIASNPGRLSAVQWSEVS
jgi:hypothetical protein